MSILAKNIRLIRRQLKCTQSVMAEILEVGFRTYVRYEAGKRDAPVSVLVKLARLGNVSLEQMLSREIGSHDVYSGRKISRVSTFPEIKSVDFLKGEIAFKKPACSELIAIDALEKRLLTLFRKMNAKQKTVCIQSLQGSPREDHLVPSQRFLKVGVVNKRLASVTPATKPVTRNRGRSGSTKINKELLKEKINRLKMITKSISKTTVK